MEVLFQNAKNGEKTASVNGLFINSSYNPSKEAERFIEQLQISWIPLIFFILEPGIPYILSFLKEKFPSSKFCVIHFSSDFSDYDFQYDFVLNAFEFDFEKKLVNSFSEELLLSSFFLNWVPSSKIYSKICEETNIIIKKTLERSKTLLITRQYFEKKWLINACNFIRYIKKPLFLNSKIDKNILIISSGPSLFDSIELIKKYRQIFYIICLSSAITVCLHNDIIPDLCLSTDGGYWAGEHLKKLNKKNIPLALPSESFCKKNILTGNKILPLDYGDGLSSKLLEDSCIKFAKAERNGTVSGTALCFALANSDKDIFFCGLDMSNQKGRQHCYPNEIEENNCLTDNFLMSFELRSVQSEYSKGSLDIYKLWFENFDLKGRNVYRIIEEKYKKNSLGQVKDINRSQFEYAAKDIYSKKITSKNKEVLTHQSAKKDFQKIIKKINLIFDSKETIKQLFPLDYTALLHQPDSIELKTKIEKETAQLSAKIRKIFDEYI